MLKVITLPDCDLSFKVKRELNARGILYEEVDGKGRPDEWLSEVTFRARARITPVLVKDDKVIGSGNSAMNAILLGLADDD